jgi:hypothetical protein
LEKPPAAQHGMLMEVLNQESGKLQQLAAWSIQFPIHPGNLTVLTIRVVIPLLGATNLISHLQHRHSL